MTRPRRTSPAAGLLGSLALAAVALTLALTLTLTLTPPTPALASVPEVPTDFIKPFSYLCLRSDPELCLGISPGDTDPVYDPAKLFYLQIKRRTRNEIVGLDYRKTRWTVNRLAGTIRLSNFTSLCMAREARGSANIALRPCSGPDADLRTWNMTQFLSSLSEQGTLSIARNPGLCAAVMKCVLLSGTTPGLQYCDPSVTTPVPVGGVFSPGAPVKFVPCNQINPDGAVFIQSIPCSPGCSPQMQNSKKIKYCARDQCGNDACRFQNGVCSTPRPTPPTRSPTSSPTGTPTTSAPSRTPSRAPTRPPTHRPSKSPTTSRPSQNPSRAPTTSKPSASPSTLSPTSRPSLTPTTSGPSASPSASPSVTPSRAPSASPSRAPYTPAPTANATNSTSGALFVQSTGGDPLLPLWIVLGILGFCCLFLLLLALYKRRKDKEREEEEARANEAARREKRLSSTNIPHVDFDTEDAAALAAKTRAPKTPPPAAGSSPAKRAGPEEGFDEEGEPVIKVVVAKDAKPVATPAAAPSSELADAAGVDETAAAFAAAAAAAAAAASAAASPPPKPKEETEAEAEADSPRTAAVKRALNPQASGKYRPVGAEPSLFWGGAQRTEAGAKPGDSPAGPAAEGDKSLLRRRSERFTEEVLPQAVQRTASRQESAGAAAAAGAGAAAVAGAAAAAGAGAADRSAPQTQSEPVPKRPARAAPPQPQPIGPSPADTSGTSAEIDVDGMSVKELKAFITKNGGDPSVYTEKAELRAKAKSYLYDGL